MDVSVRRMAWAGLFWGAAVVVASGVVGLLDGDASGTGSRPMAAASVVPARTLAAGEPVPEWVRQLARVDAALRERDGVRAAQEWREAYAAAVRNGGWEALAAVGDAAGRILRAEARQAYLAALFRARAERSPEGMRRVAEGFARVGDAEAALYARRLAGDEL